MHLELEPGLDEDVGAGEGLEEARADVDVVGIFGALGERSDLDLVTPDDAHEIREVWHGGDDLERGGLPGDRSGTERQQGGEQEESEERAIRHHGGLYSGAACHDILDFLFENSATGQSLGSPGDSGSENVNGKVDALVEAGRRGSSSACWPRPRWSSAIRSSRPGGAR
jgi:hypothetical protein